ncbi:hypothetical protein AB0G55_27160 [Streptomyces toyocaensis]|uniref:hypothetical protein n=1 Tax=Streptomyces toyocaensis TaxID=55952 RepID=UPI002E0D3510
MRFLVQEKSTRHNHKMTIRQHLAADVSGRGGVAVSQGWKITVIVLAAVGIVSTPLIWLLNSPGAGELAGASIQAAVGIAALVWTLFQHPSSAGPIDRASRTGVARDGGVTGIRRPGGRGRGAATAERTGEANGENSVSGIDYSN